MAAALPGGLMPVLEAAPGDYFAIHVVDEATGRGVPLVDLKTVNDIHLVTDSAGWAAFNEPGLLGQRVFLTVTSHGYEYPADGFGYRGVALQANPGETATVKLRRLNVAERLYRITGAGIYRDSVLLGLPTPLREPVLSGRVLGQDSVLTGVYRGRVYWFWGDTNRPEYPLGNFHTPGATSLLPEAGGLDPSRGVDLAYFVDETGFAAETAHMPGEGPTWLTGLTVLRDEAGAERMFAAYAKVRQNMDAYEWGMVEWDDAAQRFRKAIQFAQEPPALLRGNTFLHEDQGVAHVYAGNPYPLVRVRARAEDLLDPAKYEAFSCLQPGSRKPAELDRGPDGALRYAWKRDTAPLGPREQADLLKSGALAQDECLLQLRDADTGKAVQAASGSAYYNAYRKRWVMVTCEIWGTSLLGELWYAEADTPLGPWVYARKVVTHDKYDFYNPTQHPMFDQEGGRLIYFEGTYTATFGGAPARTPRYEYNQIMYRLDLADEALALPCAVYRDAATGRLGLAGTGDAAFFALDRMAGGALPVWQDAEGALRIGEAGGEQPAFHALPVDMPAPPTATVLLYQTGPGEVSTDPAPGGRAVCRVWPNPMRAGLIPGS
jgi:hypothetical protein